MISVIIPTYNEEEVIYKCIESLSNQAITDFEVIVIDDGSTDETLNILSEVPNFKFEMQVLRSDHKGAGAARNLGAAKAKGDILVFVDADMTFDESFLKKLTEPIERYKKDRETGSRGTFSKEEIVSNWDNPWARCWNINEGWEEKHRHPKVYPNSQPVFRAILKSEFERVNGFTPGGYNDDWSLWEKLGYEAESAPGATFYHKNPSSLKEVFMHAIWVGKRKYKMGLIGYVVASIRVLLPFSIITGLWKALVNKNFRFIFFKVVYDFGILMGILQYMFSGRGAK